MKNEKQMINIWYIFIFALLFIIIISIIRLFTRDDLVWGVLSLLSLFMAMYIHDTRL